jgi:hypothetical protein
MKNKTYGRLEHLNRHKLSHGNIKPYKCNVSPCTVPTLNLAHQLMDPYWQICGKSYARNDVLIRHQRQHNRDVSKAPSAPEASPQDSHTETATPATGIQGDTEPYNDDIQILMDTSMHDLQAQSTPLPELIGLHAQLPSDNLVSASEGYDDGQHTHSGHPLPAGVNHALEQPFFPTEPTTPNADLDDTFASSSTQCLPST